MRNRLIKSFNYDNAKNKILQFSDEELLEIAREIVSEIGIKYFDFCNVLYFDEATFNEYFNGKTPYEMFNIGVTSDEVNFSDGYFKIDSGGHVQTISESELERFARENRNEIIEAIFEEGKNITFSNKKLNDIISTMD